MGHVGSKTKLLAQILEKPCVCSGDLILVQILIKLGQNLCLEDFKDEYENGSCQGPISRSTNRSLGQILESQSRRLR